jgi:hypothetical protein
MRSVLCHRSVTGAGMLARPNNSLQLTRLACGKLETPCPPECARMGEAEPEPPGS